MALKRFPRPEPVPRALLAPYIGAFVNRFGTFVMPFLVLYLARSGFTVAQARLFAWNPAALWLLCAALGVVAAIIVVTDD